VRKITQNGIVFQQISERLRIGDVVHRDNLDRRITQCRAKNIPPNAPEPVDPDFHWHASSVNGSWNMNLREGLGRV
jgi:hypothetical protein